MDILYVFGGTDLLGERMLRLSLRSIARHGKGIGRVFVSAPERPRWLSESVVFVDTPRRYPTKAKDILWAIEHTIETSDIDTEFLLSSDDHFYLRDVDFDNYPYYLRGELPEEYGNPEDHYFHHLVDTRKFLLECGLGTKDFSGHVNTHFNKDIFRKYIGAVHRSYECTPYGIEPTCLMVNAIDRERGVQATPRKDIKIACANTYDNVRERIGDNECVSILSVTMDEAVGGYLENLFNEKCHYER